MSAAMTMRFRGLDWSLPDASGRVSGTQSSGDAASLDRLQKDLEAELSDTNEDAAEVRWLGRHRHLT